MKNRNEMKVATGTSSNDGVRKGGAWRRFVPLILLGLAAGIVFSLDLHAYLTLDALRQHRQTLGKIVSEQAALAIAIYVLIYATSTALSR